MERGLENNVSDIFDTVSSSLSFWGASVLGSLENLFDTNKQSTEEKATDDNNLDEWTFLASVCTHSTLIHTSRKGR